MKSCDPANARRGWALALTLGALVLAAAAVQASEKDGPPGIRNLHRPRGPSWRRRRHCPRPRRPTPS